MARSRNGRFQVNAICDVSGFKTKLNKLRKQWDGARVLPPFWDPRPQILEVPNVFDNLYVPDSRPDQPSVFVTPTEQDVVNAFLRNR